MSDFPQQPLPYYMPRLPAPPRISGTAMPHGVFLSTGTTSTASALSLFATGFTIVSLGILSLMPTYVLAWLIDEYVRVFHLSLVATLLQVGGPADPMLWTIGHIVTNALTFFVFLGALRLSPLAAHHAAEHMTVHAIERFGPYAWEDHVAEMPRAHHRCGSNLLAGILPAMLVAMPLLRVSAALAAVVVVLGWVMRRRLGFFLQNTFTTRRPTPRELARGIEAGRKLLAEWLRSPEPRLTLAQHLWQRGVPQLVAGVICALYTIGTFVDHAHVWLDW